MRQHFSNLVYVVFVRIFGASFANFSVVLFCLLSVFANIFFFIGSLACLCGIVVKVVNVVFPL